VAVSNLRVISTAQCSVETEAAWISLAIAIAAKLTPVDSKDDHVVIRYPELHGVRKLVQERATRFPTDASKLHRVVRDAFDRCLQKLLGTRRRVRAVDARTTLAFRAPRLRLRA
jgi:hypothetical protein